MLLDRSGDVASSIAADFLNPHDFNGASVTAAMQPTENPTAAPAPATFARNLISLFTLLSK
jgi:hypothetical protein